MSGRVEVKERPILFSGPMVRAILAGEKTQTRRVIKPQPQLTPENARVVSEAWAAGFIDVKCPFGAPGDRLWVRETFRESFGSSGDVFYAADHDEYELEHKGPWRPSIFMPRAASRITLEVTDVRVERLQDISDDDAQAEGVARGDDFFACPTWKLYGAGEEDVAALTARESFESLWQSINAKSYPWESNPWVWVVSFQCIDKGGFV